jgi:lambda repressor-like predicted transcriptional regulator
MKMMSKAIFAKGADNPLDGETKYEGKIRYVAAGGEWFVVYGEVSPTAEKCGSFEKLIKLYETNQSDHQISSDSSRALQTLVKSEYCPADVLHQIADKNIAMAINSAIAESPNVELETLNLLAKNANFHWEWRSLTTGYRKVLAPEENAIDFLKKNRTFQCKSSESLLIEIAPVLTELLWQELALLGLLKFYYIYDDLEGDHFGPIGLELNYDPAEYLLSPGFEVEWISKTDHVEFEYVAELVEDEWEEWEEALCSIGALATGVSLGHLEPITQKTYDEIFSEMSVMEGQFIDTDVEILPAKIKAELNQKGITFTELDDHRKMELVQHLVNTIKHPYFGGFKISQHILSLLHMHPSTPSDAKALIDLHNDLS